MHSKPPSLRFWNKGYSPLSFICTLFFHKYSIVLQPHVFGQEICSSANQPEIFGRVCTQIISSPSTLRIKHVLHEVSSKALQGWNHEKEHPIICNEQYNSCNRKKLWLPDVFLLRWSQLTHFRKDGALNLCLTGSFFTLYGLATRKESSFSQICIPVFYLDWKSTYMSQEIGYMLKYIKCILQG